MKTHGVVTRWWVGVAVAGALIGCALPPEPTPTGQVPAFTVLTAQPPIGALDFSLTTEGRLEGTLTLNGPLEVTHPVRVSVVWLAASYAIHQQPLWSSVPLQENQQLVSTPEPTAGAHAFAADLLRPPPAALRVRQAATCIDGQDTGASATLVVFVDNDEDGVLSISTNEPVDHVLSSTDFPTGLLGTQRALNALSFSSCTSTGFSLRERALTQLVYDDPLLDLVACSREDRFAVDAACGVVNESPAVFFFGTRDDERVNVTVTALRDVEFRLDDDAPLAPARLAEFTAPNLGLGEHRLRALRGDQVVWEATFTLPDRTWVRAVRPAPAGALEVHFLEVAGATQYHVIASRTMAGSGTSSPIRLDPVTELDRSSSPELIALDVGFGELPYRTNALQRYAR